MSQYPGPCALGALCQPGERKATRKEWYEVPIKEPMKKVPQDPIRQPSAISQRHLLPRKNVPSPQKFFAEHIENVLYKGDKNRPPIAR
jgi:hypothetical protein